MKEVKKAIKKAADEICLRFQGYVDGWSDDWEEIITRQITPIIEERDKLIKKLSKELFIEKMMNTRSEEPFAHCPKCDVPIHSLPDVCDHFSCFSEEIDEKEN